MEARRPDEDHDNHDFDKREAPAEVIGFHGMGAVLFHAATFNCESRSNASGDFR